MSVPDLDAIDRKLLGMLQSDFPLVNEPYLELAERLTLTESHVTERIRGLKDKGLVRQISPVVDARRLGYQSTLVAARVSNANIGRAEQVLGRHPGVSHAYEREHDFNIWFTLSLPPEKDVDGEVEKMKAAMDAEIAVALPALKVYKISAIFGVDGEEAPANADAKLPQKAELSATDRQVINVLQQDLPLAPAPFAGMANQAGMSVADFLARCQSLMERGIIRRFGASVNHRKAGYEGNAMTCWIVSPEVLDNVGRELGALPSVSHCYERKTNALWHYNLFAMFHGDTQVSCRITVNEASQRLGLSSPAVLFSTREIRKTRVKYLV